jgi:uncharacterized protein involved in exopolysaccharide biosynthesis
MQGVISHYQEQLSAIDTVGATEQDMAREVKEAESNYLLYVQKREEARIGDALDRQRIVNVAIVEAPTVPALPRQSTALTLLLGTLLATMVAPAAAFVRDRFDTSVRTPDELQDALHIPLLAALPKSDVTIYGS